MQPGFILNGFAGDEMLFGVAQRDSLKKGVKNSAAGEPAADDGPKLRLVNCHPCKTEQVSNSVGSANGNRTRILALKGLRANRCTIAPPGEERNESRIREMGCANKRGG